MLPVRRPERVNTRARLIHQDHWSAVIQHHLETVSVTQFVQQRALRATITAAESADHTKNIYLNLRDSCKNMFVFVKNKHQWIYHHYSCFYFQMLIFVSVGLRSFCRRRTSDTVGWHGNRWLNISGCKIKKDAAVPLLTRSGSTELFHHAASWILFGHVFLTWILCFFCAALKLWLKFFLNTFTQFVCVLWGSYFYLF